MINQSVSFHCVEIKKEKSKKQPQVSDEEIRMLENRSNARKIMKHKINNQGWLRKNLLCLNKGRPAPLFHYSEHVGTFYKTTQHIH